MVKISKLWHNQTIHIDAYPMHPLLILRVHTDLRFGLGHVARALAIQEHWQALGGKAILALSGDERARRMGQGLHPFLDQALPCEVVDLGENPQAPLSDELKGRASLVLIDQWEITPEQLNALRPLKVAVMEDEGDAHEVADLLFQPFLEGLQWSAAPVKTVNGRKVRPCETQRGTCRVLRGAEYAVVSPQCVRMRPRREPIQPLAAHKLLVSFGGTDGPNLAQKAFDVLKTMAEQGLWVGRCTLVAPRGIQGTPFAGCTVVSQLPELTKRIPEYDAIWCAAGLTLVESICLGVPAAAWGQNERQDDIIGDLAQANACFHLGLDGDTETLREALAHWLSPEGQETRQEQVRDGLALLDGSGASRIAQELKNLATEARI